MSSARHQSDPKKVCLQKLELQIDFVVNRLITCPPAERILCIIMLVATQLRSHPSDASVLEGILLQSSSRAFCSIDAVAPRSIDCRVPCAASCVHMQWS